MRRVGAVCAVGACLVASAARAELAARWWMTEQLVVEPYLNVAFKNLLTGWAEYPRLSQAQGKYYVWPGRAVADPNYPSKCMPTLIHETGMYVCCYGEYGTSPGGTGWHIRLLYGSEYGPAICWNTQTDGNLEGNAYWLPVGLDNRKWGSPYIVQGGDLLTWGELGSEHSEWVNARIAAMATRTGSATISLAWDTCEQAWVEVSPLTGMPVGEEGDYDGDTNTLEVGWYDPLQGGYQGWYYDYGSEEWVQDPSVDAEDMTGPVEWWTEEIYWALAGIERDVDDIREMFGTANELLGIIASATNSAGTNGAGGVVVNVEAPVVNVEGPVVNVEAPVVNVTVTNAVGVDLGELEGLLTIDGEGATYQTNVYADAGLPATNSMISADDTENWVDVLLGVYESAASVINGVGEALMSVPMMEVGTDPSDWEITLPLSVVSFNLFGSQLGLADYDMVVAFSQWHEQWEKIRIVEAFLMAAAGLYYGVKLVAWGVS